ncbi:MAG: hypothetical protein F2868_13185 [Actinobacteria bacterium]|uniref:Unannotated protein n=1 Tax=freshwater metagenome TaxID=449393 RepID=A0A6J7PW83_9ZZZZ|nr:hypothetical protein [Actinomycetota bacterium]
MKHIDEARNAAARVMKFVAVLVPVGLAGALTFAFLSTHSSEDGSSPTTSSATPTTQVIGGTGTGTGTDAGTTVGTDAGAGSTTTVVGTRPTRTTISSDVAGQTTTTVGQQSEAPVPCVLDQGQTPCGFTISGNPSGAFSPGALARHIDLQITNTNSFAITVTEITITIAHATSRVGCDGAENLIVSRPFSGTAVIPANSSVHLFDLAPDVTFAQWPMLQMPNLPSNQDACKGASFAINYTGTATS